MAGNYGDYPDPYADPRGFMTSFYQNDPTPTKWLTKHMGQADLFRDTVNEGIRKGLLKGREYNFPRAWNATDPSKNLAWGTWRPDGSGTSTPMGNDSGGHISSASAPVSTIQENPPYILPPSQQYQYTTPNTPIPQGWTGTPIAGREGWLRVTSPDNKVYEYNPTSGQYELLTSVSSPTPGVNSGSQPWGVGVPDLLDINSDAVRQVEPNTPIPTGWTSSPIGSEALGLLTVTDPSGRSYIYQPATGKFWNNTLTSPSQNMADYISSIQGLVQAGVNNPNLTPQIQQVLSHNGSTPYGSAPGGGQVATSTNTEVEAKKTQDALQGMQQGKSAGQSPAQYTSGYISGQTGQSKSPLIGGVSKTPSWQRQQAALSPRRSMLLGA